MAKGWRVARGRHDKGDARRRHEQERMRKKEKERRGQQRKRKRKEKTDQVAVANILRGLRLARECAYLSEKAGEALRDLIHLLSGKELGHMLIQLKMSIMGYASTRPRVPSWKTVGWRHRAATEHEWYPPFSSVVMARCVAFETEELKDIYCKIYWGSRGLSRVMIL
jgi:hypothetical protein